MPQPKSWAIHFDKTLEGIVQSFPSGVPDDMDWDKLESLQDAINSIWTSEDGTWDDFKRVVADYRMFWWRYKSAKDN